MKEINNTIANKKITVDEFLQIYNVFINKSDEFSKVIKKGHQAPGVLIKKCY